jgi:monoamine oxidase
MSGKSPQLSRRSLLAGAAATMTRRAFGAPASSGDFEVVIVGAGAAGIAAARRLAAAGRRYVVIEATDHIGGRCVSDTKTFGVPFDRGAHWIYLPNSNPITKLTPGGGIDIYPAPASQKVRIGLRYAREGELEDFLSAQVRATRAIDDGARKADIACQQALPNDLGDWRGAVEFVLGPYTCGKDLAQVSSLDFARAAERNAAAFCKQGFGAMLAALGRGLNVHLATPATVVDARGAIAVQTAKGTITARTAIVTVPTNVVTSGGLRLPDVNHQALDALGRLSLGSYDHIALELAGNPLALDSDDLVFEKSADPHTAAILANVSGTELCLLGVAGAFGRDLSAHGEAAMLDFAGDWLARLYGSEVKKSIGRKHATRWNSEPFALGAWSAAAPGSQSARRQLLQPIADGLWYAGEAAHETLWGTVGGAWESGERAADAVLHRLGPLRSAAPAEPEAKAKRAPSVRESQRVERHERRQERREEPRESLSPRYFGGTPTIMAPER